MFSFSYSFSLRCLEILAKRDKLRPKIDQRIENTPRASQPRESLPVENTVMNSLHRELTPHVLTFDQGMPESIPLAYVQEPNEYSFFQNYFTSPSDMTKMAGIVAQKIGDPVQPTKRQRFNHWGRKRGERFSPWAGKRSELPPLTDDDSLYALNETANGGLQTGAQIKQVLPDSLHELGATRIKREALMEGSKNSEEAEDCNGEKRCKNTVKRSLISFGSDGTKRIGSLSDILKKYENLMGETPPRSFHPWAGKKRSQREERQDEQSQEVFVSQENGSGKRSRIVKRNSNLEDEVDESTKRQSFNPWAGKRSGNLNRDFSIGWFDYPDFYTHLKTESKKDFNPWAGK